MEFSRESFGSTPLNTDVLEKRGFNVDRSIFFAAKRMEINESELNEEISKASNLDDILSKYDSNVIVSFLEKGGENSNKLLFYIVEKGKFEIGNACIGGKAQEKIKKLYIERKYSFLKDKIKGYYINGKPASINNIIKSEDCKPFKLMDNLKKLTTKDGKPISDDKIKEILTGVVSIKKASAEIVIQDTLSEIEGENDSAIDDKIKKYNEYIGKFGIYLLKLNNDQKKDFIKSILENFGLKNIKNEKLDKLLKSTEKLINSNTFLLMANKYEKFSTKENLSEIKKEGIEIDSFGKALTTPEAFHNVGIDMYDNLIESHKSVTNFMYQQLEKKIEGNKLFSWIGEKIGSLDLSDKSSKSGITKTIKFVEKIKVFLENHQTDFLYKVLGGEKLLKWVTNLYNKGKEKFNNYIEEEELIKKGYIFNTETVWLYSNEPRELDRYSIENFSKIKGTEGKNQVTSRLKFTKIIKEEALNGDLHNINSKGIVDYFYKAKIKYGDWETAIGYIYTELGGDVFKKLLEIFKNSNYEYTRNAFTKFKEENKELLEIMENFNDFTKKETTFKDLKVVEQNQDSKLFQTIIGSNVKKLLDGECDETCSDMGEKIYNVFSTSIENSEQINSKMLGSFSGILSNLVLLNSQQIIDLKDRLIKSNKQKLKEAGYLINGVLKLSKELGVNIFEYPELFDEFKMGFFTDPLEASRNLVLKLFDKGIIKKEDIKNKINVLIKEFYIEGAEDVEKKIISIIQIIEDTNLSKEEKVKKISAILSSMNDPFTREIAKRFLEASKTGLKGANREFLETVKTVFETGRIDDNVFESVESIDSTQITGSFSETATGLKRVGDQAMNINTSTTDAIVEKRQDYISDGLSEEEATKKAEEEVYSDPKVKQQVENYKKSQLELAQTGFNTKEEKEKLYNSIYYSTYLSDDLKNQVKEQAENEGIKLNLEQPKTSSIYKESSIKSNNVGNILEGKDNIDLSYEEDGGLVKIKNPFAQEGLDDNEIIGKNIKEVNEKLLLSYFTSFGFYQADELNLGKDTKKIEDMFGIDITKPLDGESIRKFSLNLASGLIYKLKDIKDLSTTNKRYIADFEKRLVENPYDSNLYSDIINLLNDNTELLIKTGYYDFTESKFDLSNFVNKEKDENYRKWLQEKDLFEKLS